MFQALDSDSLACHLNFASRAIRIASFLLVRREPSIEQIIDRNDTTTLRWLCVYVCVCKTVKIALKCCKLQATVAHTAIPTSEHYNFANSIAVIYVWIKFEFMLAGDRYRKIIHSSGTLLCYCQGVVATSNLISTVCISYIPSTVCSTLCTAMLSLFRQIILHSVTK